MSRITDWKRACKHNLTRNLINIPESFNDFWLMGGSFSSFYHSQSIRDHDIFIIKNANNNNLIYDSILARFQANENLKKSSKYSTTTKNPHIQYVFKDPISNFQYIFTDYTSREDVLKDFDMLHCCVSYDLRIDAFKISPAVAEAIKNKHIIANSAKGIAPDRIGKMRYLGWTEVNTKPTLTDISSTVDNDFDWKQNMNETSKEILKKMLIQDGNTGMIRWDHPTN